MRRWRFWSFWRLSHLNLCAMGGALGAAAIYVGLPAAAHQSLAWVASCR
jgi:hypothetical protein